MKVRARILFVAALSFCLGAFHATAQELVGDLIFERGTPPMNAAIIGLRDGSLRIRPTTQKEGELIFDPARITELRLHYPPQVARGMEAFRSADYDTAINQLGRYVFAAMPALAVTNNNAMPVISAYADSLRHKGRFKEATSVFNRIREVAPPHESRVATMWIAYLKARENDIAGARTMIDEVGELERADELFALVHLVHAWILLDEKKPTEALSHAGRAVAFSRIESNIHPEALFVSALAYEAAAEEEFAKQTAERDAARSRALKAEVNRRFVKSWEEAKAAETTPPTESEIEKNIPGAEIDSRVPPPPTKQEIPEFAVARQIFNEISRTFPQSVWAARSKPKLDALPSAEPLSNPATP
jgi:tetratricopeptide (TPR) repeat protein